MWKLIVAFVLFAALSLFVIMQGGDNLNMAGEQHGADVPHHDNPAPSQPVQPASDAAASAEPTSPAAGVQAPAAAAPEAKQ
ncbi:MAG TPA: hypothetical protein VFV43_14095 [Limnobacter sp.]|nr:hypothetical protein [Limnobacter sp.]